MLDFFLYLANAVPPFLGSAYQFFHAAQSAGYGWWSLNSKQAIEYLEQWLISEGRL